MKRITLDFETRSDADLKKQGAFKYSSHPSTRPTCLSFKIRGQPDVKILRFRQINRPWAEQPPQFREQWRAFIREGYLFIAQNAFFEQCIYKNILVRRYGWPDIPFRQFRCTAAKAAACALPRSLEGAGSALDLPVQKDKHGYVVMMATCRPRKQWNDWVKKYGADIEKIDLDGTILKRPAKYLEPSTAPDIFSDLYRYCATDTATEEQLDVALPDLNPFEQEVWFLNQQINWRGFKIDTPLVRKIVSIMADENKKQLRELDKLTMGLVTKPGARQDILDFLALEGIELPDIKAKTVEDYLEGFNLKGDARRLLEIRKALSKTSTKKYQAFLDRVSEDGRVRDILLYHGASTGRDTGTGVQPHNFPKPIIEISKERPFAPVENVVDCDVETLKLLYGENLSLLFSSILRNMIIASDGKELFVADFAKIEVAVLWWLAKNAPGLKILKAGKDPYIYMAMRNTGKAYDKISEDERQLGKAQVLGCGFRMSWKRFKDAAWSMYRLKLTSRQSVKAVKDYREANSAVVDLWSKYEEAAVMAVETGQAIFAGRCKFKVENRFLWVTLPSGRKLAYYKPTIVMRAITWTALEIDEDGNDVEVEKTGEPRKTLQFLGLALNKKDLMYEFSHGGILTENIVQAVARDLMVESLLRLERAGYQVLLQVHDEIICERRGGNIEEFTKLMVTKPKWTDEDLPLDAKAWRGPRYAKR